MAIVVATLPAIASAQPYFPQRTSGERIATLTGTLVDFSSGMNEGHVLVRDAHGRVHDFYRARVISIDGQAVHCMQPPRAGFVPSRLICETWPPYIHFGVTRVRVSWWIARRSGVGTIAVTDRIVTLGER
jgi:hypothetical protein